MTVFLKDCQKDRKVQFISQLFNVGLILIKFFNWYQQWASIQKRWWNQALLKRKQHDDTTWEFKKQQIHLEGNDAKIAWEKSPIAAALGQLWYTVAHNTSLTLICNTLLKLKAP